MPDALNANGDSRKNIMPKTLTFSTDLINSVLQYLGTRPFQEVAQLINGLQSEAGPQVKQEEEITTVETH
jgi:hypothetical protein